MPRGRGGKNYVSTTPRSAVLIASVEEGAYKRRIAGADRVGRARYFLTWSARNRLVSPRALAVFWSGRASPS